MQLKQLFLGTSALIGAGLLTAGPSLPATAAEVTPGGKLDVEISGFVRFLAHGGDLDEARLDPTLSTGLDFSNDTEVHIIVRGKDDRTGTEYGGTVEFEADTNRTDNTDESWIFLRGGFGEVRLGDEDGVADNSAVGAQTIAAGTGGIDGSVVDVITIPVVYPTNSNDATKIRYYTPSFGGFQAGVSYTPNQAVVDSGALNGDSLATTDVDVGDLVEGALVYDGDFAGFGITASLVGGIADVKNEDTVGGDDFWTWLAGLSTELFGFKVAGSFGDEEIGAFERTWFTAGIGYGYGPVNTSVTWGQILDEEGFVAGNAAYNPVFSADSALMPALVLAGDIGLFDNDAGGDDAGWQAVGRLGLAF